MRSQITDHVVSFHDFEENIEINVLLKNLTKLEIVNKKID